MFLPFQKKRTCVRCDRVVVGPALVGHINGLCIPCWRVKPRVSLPPGKYEYRTSDGRYETFTIHAGWYARSDK